MNKAKNPSTVLYWNDIDQDPAVNACSIAAQGLWWKMLACAARSPELGVVLLGNHPSTLPDLPRLFAKIIGETVEATAVLLDELVTMGVPSVDEKGRVYNRRMVREEAARKAVSEARSRAGKRSADVKKDRQQEVNKTPTNDATNTPTNGQQPEQAPSGWDYREIPVPTNDPQQQTDNKDANKNQPSSLLHYFSSSKTIDVTTDDLSPSAAPISETPQDSEPVADHLAIPEFLRRPGGRIAQPISPDWLPSRSAQNELEKARPDLTPEIVQSRMVEFRNWCATDAVTTHNADATWFGFMRKTYVQQPARTRQSRSESTELDGVAAAFARRSVPSG